MIRARLIGINNAWRAPVFIRRVCLRSRLKTIWAECNETRRRLEE
jgi:hypothetical protein